MKSEIKRLVFFLTVFTATILFIPVFAQQKFDESILYRVMSSGDTNLINNEIKIVEMSTLTNKDGYDGALLMKKAGLVTDVKEKLKLFKRGRIKMETALRADNGNTGLHFLRLAIEEHAPKIVNYNADIETDKIFIQKNFKSLSPVVQRAILDYCKNSKVLRSEDF